VPGAPDDSHDVVREVGLRMTAGDGVVLVADAWHPAAGGPWPVLLQRLPYGRSVASTPVLPHPAWLARLGFAVVVQDCRGRGDSGGRFSPFVDEGPDGAEAVTWAAGLPFADGRVVTYGFSYQGLGQLYAAARRPPALRGVAAMMCCPDPYDGWTYEGGCLRLPFVAFWSAQLAGQDRRTGPVPYDVRALPVTAALGPGPPPWFGEWLAHPGDDGYWADRRPDLTAIDVPVFTALGYFDDFSTGTARLIAETGAEAVCGPWLHMPWGSHQGGVDLGPDAEPGRVTARLLAFFDRVLGRGPAPARNKRVTYLTVGAGWRGAASWPPPHRMERWIGTSRGNANSRHGDGVLVASAGTPAAREPDTLVVEPLVPFPGEPVAHQDETGSEDRRDVLCYTSAPRPAPLDLAGSPTVTINVSCDRPAHDLVATLVLVTDAGARALSGGALRCTGCDGVASDHRVQLRPVAWRVPAGARLRLDVSGARFPAFDRNPHTGQPVAGARAEDMVVATLTVEEVALDLPIDLASEQ
jgi:putative CocE/NonD family hydrolase